MKSTTKTLAEDFGAQFLLPEDVGSSVRWSLAATQYTTQKGERQRPKIAMDVNLTDCTRTITWSEYEDGVKMAIKLDRAIQELTLARRALRKAMAVTKKTEHDVEDDEDF